MSAVAVIDRAYALRRTAEALGLTFNEGEAPALNRPLLAQSLRRAVFIAAPCDAHTARSLSLSALAPLTDDVAALKTQIDDALHDLISMGDILELRVDSGERSDIILRPAPPAFVLRRDGSLLVLGVSGDEITPALEIPVVYHASGLRSVRPADAQSCRSALLDLGLICLSASGCTRPARFPPLSTSRHGRRGFRRTCGLRKSKTSKYWIRQRPFHSTRAAGVRCTRSTRALSLRGGVSATARSSGAWPK